MSRASWPALRRLTAWLDDLDHGKAPTLEPEIIGELGLEAWAGALLRDGRGTSSDSNAWLETSKRCAQAAVARRLALEPALVAMEAARLQWMVVKGSAIEASAIGAIGSRDACDVDVLVTPADADRAVELLVGLGATIQPEVEAVSGAFDRQTFQLHLSFAGQTIDLHRSPMPWPCCRPGPLFADSSLIDELRVPAPAAIDLVGIMHCAASGFDIRGKDLIDTWHLHRWGKLDPTATMALAEACGALRALAAWTSLLIDLEMPLPQPWAELAGELEKPGRSVLESRYGLLSAANSHKIAVVEGPLRRIAFASSRAILRAADRFVGPAGS